MSGINQNKFSAALPAHVLMTAKQTNMDDTRDVLCHKRWFWTFEE